MEKEKPDNIVYTQEKGYHANSLSYGTNVGAPFIQIEDVVAWKNRGINSVNKELENRFKALQLQYEMLLEEYEWNTIVYSAKFTFEPVVGEIYHLYRNADGTNFLSLISPTEWEKEHLGTFQLNSDKKWILIQQ